MSVLVKANSVANEGELELNLTPELLSELGVERGATLAIDAVNGTLVVRRATITEQTAGMGAPWRIFPVPTPQEEDEAVARAIAEDNASDE